MWYVGASLLILFVLVLAGRLLSGRRQAAAVPAVDLLPPELPPVPSPSAYGITVKLRAAPGAPNTDPPTDHHITPSGTATITRRTGRRRSTTSV